ncbi:DUF1127 domain-containing protein [Vreelandella salicampi]|uniref:DUF1127 domain-containing protein n=1 Tax=Vreelandella salicampi TaxID=1449798 RepID=A0A7Z0LLY0_9GAMM|nr:DUF1127 domain-containing protein [Halomonas salicampi]NYS61383.1 DUF1127 domain-containing protein [Halomonas salicampi]
MPRFRLTQLRYQLQHYQQCRRSRRQLLALDDRLLEDIGITRAQARKEGHKPFWQQTSFKRGPDENH